jgi:hypothetical protein
MSSFVAFWSRRISLAERSCSSFTLVVFILCAGEYLPPSSDDSNEGCQWEIQTDEGWGFLLGLTGVGHLRRPTLF